MRPARIIAAVVVAAAVVATGSYLALSTASHPAATPQPPGTTSPVGQAPTGTPQPSVRPATPPSTGRCDASALEGSVLGTEGAAGTIWYTIRLRNASAGTCTVKGVPQVRLLGAQGQPVTAPSRPDRPGGSLVTLRPGQAASFAFGVPNVCDTTVVGSRLGVTLPSGQGSLVVQLAGEARFGTCGSVHVQPLQAHPQATVATSPLAGRISDPQVAADRLVAAWVRGDRVAARGLSSQEVTDRLFSESPPASTPVALPCRLADLGMFVCSYPVAERAELSIFVQGGASAGYGISGVEFGD